MTRYQGLSGIADVGQAAGAIIDDPCLPEAVRLVLRLKTLEAARKPPPRPGGPPRPGAPPAPPAKGIGLCHAVPGLKLFVAYREKPWTAAAIALAAIGGVFFLGYATGRT